MLESEANTKDGNVHALDVSAQGEATDADEATDAEQIPVETLLPQLEALLFVSPQPLGPRQLAKLLGVNTRRTREAIEALREQCEARGIEPVEVAGGYQFRTKPAHAELLRSFLQAKPSRLSRAALESLAIVAYKQPLTRAEVEDIRGVDSGAVLRGLLERRLLRILGRKEEPGRPILYGTSSTFLELFGLKSLKELPTLREFVELSDEHQRLVEREAPTEEQAARRELEDYLADLQEVDEAAEPLAPSGQIGGEAPAEDGDGDGAPQDEASGADDEAAAGSGEELSAEAGLDAEPQDEGSS